MGQRGMRTVRIVVVVHIWRAKNDAKRCAKAQQQDEKQQQERRDVVGDHLQRRQENAFMESSSLQDGVLQGNGLKG